MCSNSKFSISASKFMTNFKNPQVPQGLRSKRCRRSEKTTSQTDKKLPTLMGLSDAFGNERPLGAR